jgi:hypothetical protein
MNKPEVEIILRATDRASRVLEETGGNAEILSKRLDKVSTYAIAAGAGLMGMAAGGVAILKSSTRLAARVEMLGIVTETLGRNAGMTTTEVRALEGSLQDKGITLQAARQSIAQMIQAEIDLAHATTLARLAQDAAVISGQNSSEAFNSLVTVIATGNTLMARNMGLMVDFQAAYEDGAVAIGKAVTELTAQEKIQIRTNEVMRLGGTIAGTYEASMTTAAKKMASLDRHIEESTRALGEMWLPTYAAAVDAVTASLVKWQDLDQSQKDNVSSLIAVATATAGTVGSILMGFGVFVKTTAAVHAMNTAFLAATGGAMGLTAAMATIVLPVSLVVAGITALTLVSKKQTEQLEETKRVLNEVEDELFDTTNSYDEYITKLKIAAEQEGYNIDSQGNLVRAFGQSGVARADIIEKNVALTESEYEQVKAVERYMEIHGDYLRGLYDIADATGDAEQATKDFRMELIKMDSQALASAGLRELDQAYKDGLISAEEYRQGTRMIWEALMDVDQAQIDLSLTMIELNQKFKDGEISTYEYIAALRQLEGKYVIDVETKFNIVGEPWIPPGIEPPGIIQPRQHGGPVYGGKPYIVGEAGPELFIPSHGGQIIPNHNVSNYMTMNIHTSAPHEPIIDDFEMMRAWMGA